MSSPDPLPVAPFTRPVRGRLAPPGSKSITNRALPLAALCLHPVTLTGALASDDTRLMVAALRQLGCTVETDEAAATLRVSGQDKLFLGEAAGRPDAPVELFVGLAGTAARFLTALCGAAPAGRYRLDGVPQMRRRPMRGLIDALRTLGSDVRCLGEEGFFPLEIHARGLAGGDVEIDASESSQLLSALLMVAPLARGDVRVTLASGVRWSYVEMTAAMMQAFAATGNAGATAAPVLTRESERVFTVHARRDPYDLAEGTYAIEPDASAASYFLALPLVTGGALTVAGARDSGQGLQGDTAFADVMRAAGATITALPGDEGLLVSFDAELGRRASVQRDFHAISDTFLTLAAISPLLPGRTRITGIAHTRKQETDRVAGMATELRRLGQDVVEEEDSLTIDPRPERLPKGPALHVVETYHDHRFAMSFGVLGCHDLRGNGQPWLSIANPSCCAKTFPAFFDELARLRGESQ